jgi:hypothetical protein
VAALALLLGPGPAPAVPVASRVAGAPLAGGSAAAAQVAFLEDWPEHSEASGEDVYQSQIRVAFVRDRGGWSPARELRLSSGGGVARTGRAPVEPSPGPRRWIVVARGESIGVVTSGGPAAPEGPRRNALALLDTVPARLLGPRDGAFAGWNGLPVRPPRVATDRRPGGNPDDWRAPDSLPAATDRMGAMIRASVADLGPCDEPRGMPRAELSFGAGDLVVRQVLVARDGSSLIGVEFASDRVCEGGAPAGRFWFAEPARDSLRFLGASMTWIDTGDYDGDGRSEAAFWYDRHRENGYMLVWDGGRRSASFGWTY